MSFQIPSLGALLATLLVASAGTKEPSPVAPAAKELVVDVGTVLNDTRHRPIGINLDYLMDDERNPLLAPRRGLAPALRELRSGSLRYPGGWKSAINLWSVPPFTASRPALAGQVPEGWLRSGLRLTAPDGAWLIQPLDFDKFMELSRTVRAEPFVVVAYESCHWPQMGAWKPPSREQLLDTAAAWVRYSNKVKNYAVRYWEVGNESWLNNETWSNGISSATYAADLVEFSKRMKAEDPAIQIGANGDSEAWWKTVLSKAADHIDFLSVHTYPCWKWAGYEDYRTNSADPLGPVRVASAAIAKYAPAHRHRLRLMVTEFAVGTFGDWDKTPADLGRALLTFDLQGQLLQCRGVWLSQFWNTHNIYSEVDGGVFDALKRDNSLSPIGRALWIWGQFLVDEMVATTSASGVRCFASHKPGRRLVIFLVNKEASERSIRVTFQHLPSHFTRGVQWVLRGSGPEDRNPVWQRTGDTTVHEATISNRLDPVSITVIALEADAGARTPGN